MTLQEYLVKLGWSIDEPSMKRFFGAIASTGAVTAELGATALETAGAVEAMVTRIARKYETLYYVSQRSGQSVKYIQSTQFAFQQIGLSAEEATQSIESMGAKLRTQPWLKGIFGGASTPQEVANKLGKSGLPYFLQARFAEMIGMDEKTLFHLQRFGKIEEEARADMVRRQKEAGIDPDALAKKTADYGRVVNKLESELEILGDRILMDFLGPVSWSTEKLEAFVEWLVKADVATNGWITTIGTLAGTVGGLAILKKLAGKILGRGVAAEAAAAGAPEVAGAAGSAGLLGTAGALALPLTAAAGAIYAGYKTAKGQQKYVDDQARKSIDFFKAAGFPEQSAIGITSALYSESGLDPNKRNPYSGAYGLGQWLTKDRIAGIEKRLGIKLQGSSTEDQLRAVLYELTQGDDPQARQAGKQLYQTGLDKKQAAGTFIHLFERPGAAGELSDMSRAGPMADRLSGLIGQQNAPVDNSKSITLNSKVDVHPAPGADVMSTAKAYGDAHDDVNANLLRNLQGMR